MRQVADDAIRRGLCAPGGPPGSKRIFSQTLRRRDASIFSQLIFQPLRRAIQQVTSRRTVAWIEQDNRLQLMAFEKSLFQGASTVSESDFRGDTTWLDRVSSTDSDDE